MFTSTPIKYSTLAALSFTSLSILYSANPSLAVIPNGSFESGDFTDWLTTGGMGVVAADFADAPVEGSFQAFLTNEAGRAGELATPAWDLETFLELPTGALNALAGPGAIATEGSAMKLTFFAEANDVLSFNWQFLTNENIAQPDPLYRDFSFFTLSGTHGILAAIDSLFLPSSSTILDHETARETFSYQIPTAGMYTLGIGVVDVGDAFVASGLLVDNVALSQPTLPGLDHLGAVPEVLEPAAEGSILETAVPIDASAAYTTAGMKSATQPDPSDESLWLASLSQSRGSQTSTSVPEPASVIGMLAFGVFGAGALLKHKERIT